MTIPFGLSFSYEPRVSPDGLNLYAIGQNNALLEFARSQTTGALTEIGCVTSETGKECSPINETEKATAMSNPAAIVISPDGKDAYVIAQEQSAVITFERSVVTGLLTETGCISREASSGCELTKAHGMNLPYGIAISPGGENVYVAALADEAVAEFARNQTTGALTPLAGPHECISDTALSECGTDEASGLGSAIGVVVSPDGKNLYVAAGGTSGKGDIAEFARDASKEGALTQLSTPNACLTSTAVSGCSPANDIEGPEDLVMSPDGKNVYTNSFSDNSVIELSRDASTGTLSQLPSPNECITTESTSGCTQVAEIAGPLGVAISPEGSDLYVDSAKDNAVAAFTRDSSSGALAQFAAPYECLTEEPSGCATVNAPGLNGARRLTVSPDGANVYVSGQNSASIAELARVVPPKESGGGGGTSGGGGGSGEGHGGPPPPRTVPPPVLAKTGNVAPVSGTVRVRLPGSSTFIALSEVRQIPFGSVVDATDGKVSVTSAIPGGGTQTGTFFDGEFILSQGKNGVLVATLTGGDFSVCPTAKERSHIARASAAHALPKHVVRKLWADAHGKFSTKGNYAAGAVLGTEWLTEDLCDGTLIKVTRDKVAVTNLVNHRHKTVKAKHSYLAKAP